MVGGCVVGGAVVGGPVVWLAVLVPVIVGAFAVVL